MNFDPRTRAREEAEDEADEREQLADFLTAVRCLLVNGEKKAAILLIEKAFTDKESA